MWQRLWDVSAAVLRLARAAAACSAPNSCNTSVSAHLTLLSASLVALQPATTSWEQVPTRGYNTLAASSIASKANAGLPYRVTDTDMMADNRKGAVPLAQTPPRPMTPPGAGTPKREVSIVVAATAQPEPAPPPSATGAGHKRAISTASMYDVTDLGECRHLQNNWQALMYVKHLQIHNDAKEPAAC